MGFDRRTGRRAGRTLIWTVGALLAASLSGHAALAQEGEPGLAKWNQEAVTKVAKDLHENVLALRSAFMQRAMPPTVGSGQRNAFYQLRDDLRIFDSTALGLYKTLEKGEGHEETLPRFKRLEQTRRDIVEQARRVNLTNDVLNLAEPVRASLQQLRPYYLAQDIPEDVMPDLEKGEEGKGT